MHGNRKREAMKEREREATMKWGKKQRKRERNTIHTEIEIEGGNEAWDTERETEKRKRQNGKEYIDWA